MELTMQRRLLRPFSDVRLDIISALESEGFGILSEIDLQAKFHEKLGKSVGSYVILGACNPALAWDATRAVPELAALLPCNVVLRQDGGEVVVDVMDPEAALGLIDNDVVTAVAVEAKARLRRALGMLAA